MNTIYIHISDIILLSIYTAALISGVIAQFLPEHIRIRKLRGDGPTDVRNDLRDQTKVFLSAFTVGCEWAFTP